MDDVSPIFRSAEFLVPAQCHILISAFLDNPTMRATIPDPFFAGRVMWTAALPIGHPAKSIINEAARDAAAMVGMHFAHPKALIDDGPQIVHWPAGRDMPPHVDNAPDCPTPWREFAAVVYLNADYEAGEIHFPTLGETLKPSLGELVAFRGSLPHGVHAPTADRFTMPMWFRSRG